MAEFPMLALSGYDVDEPGYDECPVLGFFGHELRDKAVLYGMERVLKRRHGYEAVHALPEKDGTGTLLLAILWSDELLDTVRELRRVVANDNIINDDDYDHVLREAVEAHWGELDIAGRIACCRATGNSLACALQASVPDPLQLYLEHQVEQW